MLLADIASSEQGRFLIVWSPGSATTAENLTKVL